MSDKSPMQTKLTDDFMASLKKKASQLRSIPIFQDSFWAIAGSIIGRGASLLAGIIVARFLGKELFGEYGTIKNTLTYAAIVSTFGFGYTATKYIADYLQSDVSKIKSLVKTLLLFTFAIGACLSVIVTIYSNSITAFLEAEDLEWSIKNFSALILFNAITASQTGILSGFKKFRSLAQINAVSGIFTLISSSVLTFFYGINGAIGALLLSFIVQAIYSQIVIHIILREYSGNVKLSFLEFKSILSFSLPIALQESLYTVVHWVSILLLIKYANYGEVGLSSAAATWKSIVIFIPSVLKNVMFSYLSSSKEHGALVISLIKYNLFASLAPAIVFALGAPLIVQLYGGNFSGLTPVLIVALLSAIIICVSEVFCYEFISIGKPWTVFFARMMRDSLSLLLAYIVLINVDSNQALFTSLMGALCQILFLFFLLFFYRKIR